MDVIGESDAGKTFYAFWRLLHDGEQSAVLADALAAVTARPFAQGLRTDERRFLRNLTSRLMDEGAAVHVVLQTFARGLKSFVKSREFLENRRLHSLLKLAQRAAVQAKEVTRPNQSIGYELLLTGSRIDSASRWRMQDPSERVTNTEMPDAEPGDLSLEAVGELVRQSEIDTRTLKRNIYALLQERSQVSLVELLETFDAEQGLASVVGYIALGAEHGHVTRDTALIRWTGSDQVVRHARAPAVYFLKENAHVFAS